MKKPPPLSATAAAEAMRRAEALERTPPHQCCVEGCERRRFASGYCSAHRQQWARAGTITSATIREYHKRPRVCKMRGCRRRAVSRGLCSAHYMRALRGNLNPSVPIRTRKEHDEIHD